MSIQDEDVRIRTVNGRLVFGAMSKVGIDTLTDLVECKDILDLEEQGVVEIRRLPGGDVYLIIAEEGYISVEEGYTTGTVQ